MTRTPTIPATQNEGWGFFGTMGPYADAAWPLAMRAIADATECSLEAVRAFLDSRYGRHFADEVRDGIYSGQSVQQSIDAATQRWNAWTIGRQVSRDYGIPRGLAYLTGFVTHCGIVEESASA